MQADLTISNRSIQFSSLPLVGTSERRVTVSTALGQRADHPGYRGWRGRRDAPAVRRRPLWPAARWAGGGRVPDCEWARAVSENLHEGREGLLLVWRAARPVQDFDHLASRDLDMRLEIPGHVLRALSGDGRAIADERTGSMHGGYNHPCVAISLRSPSTGTWRAPRPAGPPTREHSEAGQWRRPPDRCGPVTRRLLRSARSGGLGQRGVRPAPPEG
jgi:hypothetical protein